MGFKFRLCEVDGEQAYFHRWIIKDDFILKFKDVLISEDVKKHLEQRFFDDGVVELGCDIFKSSETLALVEFVEDGRVMEVEPSMVRFLTKPEETM